MKRLILWILCVGAALPAGSRGWTTHSFTQHEAQDRVAEAPLVVIDGRPERYEALGGIDPATVQRMTLLTPELAGERYGEPGRHGAILIVLGPDALPSAVRESPAGDLLYVEARGRIFRGGTAEVRGVLLLDSEPVAGVAVSNRYDPMESTVTDAKGRFTLRLGNRGRGALLHPAQGPERLRRPVIWITRPKARGYVLRTKGVDVVTEAAATAFTPVK